MPAQHAPTDVAADCTQPFDCVLGAWRRYEGELRGFLRQRLDAPDLAEDLLQEVFLRALRQGQGFCRLEQSRAWLFQVARNALIDHARTTRPHAPLPETLVAPGEEERPPVDALDACLGRNLARLSAEDRAILEACDLRGQTVKAYAQHAGLSLAAAKSRLLRARQRLRDALVQHCQVQFDAQGRGCCHVPPEARASAPSVAP